MGLCRRKLRQAVFEWPQTAAVAHRTYCIVNRRSHLEATHRRYLINFPTLCLHPISTHLELFTIHLLDIYMASIAPFSRRSAGHHYQHSYSRWASGAHTYAPPQAFLPFPSIIPPQLSFSEAPYYGYEFPSRLCARFIRSLFKCTSEPMHQSLSQFIAYALYRSKLQPQVTYAALLLLHRFKTHYPKANGESGRQLFISAMMIAAKVLNDTTFANRAWVTISQNQFSHRLINQMEREMCRYMDYKLTIFEDVLYKFEKAVKRDFSEDRESYSSYSSEIFSKRKTSQASQGWSALVNVVPPAAPHFASSHVPPRGPFVPAHYYAPAPPSPSPPPSPPNGWLVRPRSLFT